MDYDAPVIYGLEFQSRALTSYSAENDLVQFFVGTQSLRCTNQIHLITFDDEANSISKQIFNHPEGEIWSLATPPSQKNILTSVYSKVNGNKTEMQATVWKFISEDGDISISDEENTITSTLTEIFKINNSDLGDIKGFLWYPSVEKNDFVVLIENHIQLYSLDINGSSAALISETMIDGKLHPKFTTGIWDPHHNCTSIVTAQDTSVKGWDLRSMKQTYTIENAHTYLVRNLSYNPNKQYYVASCGDDCKAKFWDVRKVNEPVKILNDHSHWVWNVKYNHFHDQLVLTSSSDGTVLLNNLSSISSEPFGNLLNDEDGDDDNEADKNDHHSTLADGIVMRYDEHEDSVYALEWSSSDPWLFASLSYDGRLVMSRVPRSIKYQILL
ncbi:hypothetical protein HELRODRAFT_185174 [Helobdella robusta]|uniref:EIPR1-like beta-propeller domain-containing protein n=1 Tax=Helobdella robusta TaxID=6412 RepID=T1FMG9_HELRO|nr:hypothetical protein HELRODRAFT_185174 [Helobdella robusta]ESN93075.1 hypothetical protein HELRODRAFT_185174 [Helobdella robusta]